MSEILRRLHLKYPLIVAPMAGGPSSPELVIAASEAGALGCIGGAYSSALQIEEFVQKVRRKTSKPIGLNLFIPHGNPKFSEAQAASAIEATKFYREELGLPLAKIEPPFEEDFDSQFEVTLKLKPDVFSFLFGLLKAESIQALKKEKIFVIGTATSAEEAQALADLGVDAITLQGFEGGGHRGLFDATTDDPEIPLFELLKITKGKVKIPLIAAGGIMNSRDIQKILSAGADAVQMGTAFLACEEAGTSQPYRQALLESSDRQTKTTRVFSGRLARGLENRFMREMEKTPDAILPFPVQNKLTRDLRAASVKKNSKDFLSLWAGTGKGPLWEGSATDLIQNLFV